MDNTFIFLFIGIICLMIISFLISSSLGVGGYVYTTSSETSTSTPPPIVLPKPSQSQQQSQRLSPPSLLNNKIHYQGECDDCDGLGWLYEDGSVPWNQYYKFTCIDDKNDRNVESLSTQVFGPVSHFNWQMPKIRLNSNGVSPCGNNKVVVYRGNDPNSLLAMTMMNFDMNKHYDGKDAIFTDNTPNAANKIA